MNDEKNFKSLNDRIAYITRDVALLAKNKDKSLADMILYRSMESHLVELKQKLLEEDSLTKRNILSYQRNSLISSHKTAVKHFNSLTYAIIDEITPVLNKAKLMPVPELQSLNPELDEVIVQLKLYRRLYCTIINLLKLDNHHELIMLDEKIALADNLAQAIKSDNDESIFEAISAMNIKPYI